MKTRTDDPVIEEIRAARRDMSARCGHDLGKLVEYLKPFNTKYARQIEMYEKTQRLRSRRRSV